MSGAWRNGLRQGQAGYWHFRFRMHGRQHEGNTGCTSYREALTWLAAYKGRLAKGEVGIKVAPTFKQAFEHMLEQREGKASKAHLDRARRAIEKHVLPVFGQIPCDQITTEAVEDLVSRYLNGANQSIVYQGQRPKRTKAGANTLLLYVKMVFNHVVRIGLLDRLPFEVKPLKAQQPHRAWVPIERESAFFAAIDCTRNLPVMLAVRAMFWLGLRESEALCMRWEGLAWDLSRYTPGSTVHDRTKGGEAEPLPTEQGIRILLWAIIWEHFNGTKPLGGWVIPAEDGKPHRQQFTKKAIQRAGKAIGIPGLTPHRLRASFATNLARAGYGAHHIKKALRHKQLQTSEAYVRLAGDDLQAGLDTLKRRAKGE